MNLTIFSYILLALFAASVAVAYINVRRGTIKPLQAGIYACIANVIIVTLFSLSAENGFLRAIITGLIFGIMFGVVSVAAAAFFRRNETAKLTD